MHPAHKRLSPAVIRNKLGALRLVSTLGEFIKDPFDACVVRPAFLFWQRGKDLNGVRVLGALTVEAVDELFAAFETDVHPAAEPHASIVDFRLMTYTDLEAMNHFAETLLPRLPRFKEKVRRRLIVHGRGGLGIAVGGVRFQVPDLYPVRFVIAPEPHLEWLGVDPSDPILAWLDETLATHAGLDDFLRRLRSAFAAGHDTLAKSARALGLSARSLQRELARRGVSFRIARRDYRIDVARDLLTNATDLMTLEAVAQRAGFAAQRHLARAFSEALGVTPETYRRKHHPRLKGG